MMLLFAISALPDFAIPYNAVEALTYKFKLTCK
jgi:hypothetical protein